MKIRVEIECTPQEARALMGLPDVEPLHQMMLSGMQDKMQDAMRMMEPESFIKQWAPIGMQSLEQLQKFLWGAARSMSGSGTPSTSPPETPPTADK